MIKTHSRHAKIYLLHFKLFTGRCLLDNVPETFVTESRVIFLREKQQCGTFKKKKRDENKQTRNGARERSNFEYKCKLVSPLITSVDTFRAMRLAGLLGTMTFFSSKVFGPFFTLVSKRNLAQCVEIEGN